MILGGKGIAEMLASGAWEVFGDKHPTVVGPNSVDVRLSDQFWVPDYNTDTLTPGGKFQGTNQKLDRKILYQGDFILGCTQERFRCTEPYKGHTFAPMYEGRSSVGRMGLASHVTAGFGDYGFEGAFTLELYNVNPRPIILVPDMRIGQVYFVSVLDPVPYTGAYSGKDHYSKPVPPNMENLF